MRPGFWRKCRVGFRWCRISALLLVLAGLCLLIWCNRVGLPDFLKKPLVENLRARGLEVEFSRLRLHLVRGLVAENVRVGHTALADGPNFSVGEIQLRLNFSALLQRRLQIDELVLRQGKLVWPLTPTNALTLNNIQTELRLQTNDLWSLDNFQADFAGAKFFLSGDVAHASEIRRWEFFRGRKSASFTVWQAQLKKFSDVLDRIHFAGAPELSLTVNGDARFVRSFVARADVTAPSVQTPWGEARDVRLSASLDTLGVTSTNVDASWGFWTNAQPFRFIWTAQLADLQSEKLKADSLVCGGFWEAPALAVTNLSARVGGGWLEAQARLNVATRQLIFTNSACFDFHAIAPLLTARTHERLVEIAWGRPPLLQAGGSLILPAWTNRQPDWRGEVQPTVQLNGTLAITNGIFQGKPFDWLLTRFSYANLAWQLPDLFVAQGRTRLALAGGENDRTKNYHWRVHGAFDPASLRPFLTASNAVNELNQLKFAAPLALDAEISGRLYDYDDLDASGHLALTNFVIRGQSVDRVAGDFHYTNRALKFFNPRLVRQNGKQTMAADEITLDFRARRICFTNGFSTADPEAVARAIGPKTGELLESYRFLEPPSVRVNGCAPLRNVQKPADMTDADLSFEILNPAPFQWHKLKTPGVAGTIHWLGAQLILTNVTGSFYGGDGNGFAIFDFAAPHAGADFQFAVAVTNADLHALATDLSGPTNHLEGVFTAQIAVTNADSEDWKSWNGDARAQLRDGMLWDVPVFGIMSPVLNAISPGLGNSRATAASAQFNLTHGVFFSDSLEIRSTMTRLQYSGSVTLKQKVNARVTAQLLRDTPMIGSIISTLLWPVSKVFEYKITGELAAPKIEPVYYVPKILLAPLHPWQSLQELIPGNADAAPPEN